MSIDLWGIGLQAINVLILIWLLFHVFWRPIAAAIASRQQAAMALIDNAGETQARADAALAEATRARDGIAAERSAMLDQARSEAEATAKATRDEAQGRAEAILVVARDAAEKEREAARVANDRQARDLALDIAGRLLGRMDGPEVQAAFLAQLTEAIAALPAAERAALTAAQEGIEIVTSRKPGAQEETIRQAVLTALGGAVELRFVVDPELIGGLELRSPHFVLHNSWRADLAQVRKAVQDAA